MAPKALKRPPSEKDRRPRHFRATKRKLAGTSSGPDTHIATAQPWPPDNCVEVRKTDNGSDGPANADEADAESASSLDPFDLVFPEVLHTIDFTALEELGSGYNEGMTCHRLSKMSNGIYNMMFFLEFEDRTQWVARITARSTSRRPLDDPPSQPAILSTIAAMTR